MPPEFAREGRLDTTRETGELSRPLDILLPGNLETFREPDFLEFSPQAGGSRGSRLCPREDMSCVAQAESTHISSSDTNGALQMLAGQKSSRCLPALTRACRGPGLWPPERAAGCQLSDNILPTVRRCSRKPSGPTQQQRKSSAGSGVRLQCV